MPLTISAQAMRAILLAKAIAAILVGLRAISSASQARRVYPTCLARRITDKAPTTRWRAEGAQGLYS